MALRPHERLISLLNEIQAASHPLLSKGGPWTIIQSIQAAISLRFPIQRLAGIKINSKSQAAGASAGAPASLRLPNQRAIVIKINGSRIAATST